MLRLVMESAGLTFWPMLSLLIFFGSTLCVLLWIFRPGSSDFYHNLGKLALQDHREDAQPDAAPGAEPQVAASFTPKTPSEN